MNDWPYKRRRAQFSRPTCLMLVLQFVVLVLACERLYNEFLRPAPRTVSSAIKPSDPFALTARDVLPTPTPDFTTPVRMITFPGVALSAPIIPAGRMGESWETRHLGDSVGHLVGTGWLDGPGANIVLAGHVESSTGAPGPFAHLFEAQIGDLIILSEGTREARYRITAIERTGPYDVRYVSQSGSPRLTLITCTDWDYSQGTYQGRLVVVAEPIVLPR